MIDALIVASHLALGGAVGFIFGLLYGINRRP